MNPRFVIDFQVGSPKVVLIRFALPNWCSGPYNKPNKMKSIIILDLFCNITLGALKYINIIYPKANQLVGQFGFLAHHHLS
jgi:hypothetical protein